MDVARRVTKRRGPTTPPHRVHRSLRHGEAAIAQAARARATASDPTLVGRAVQSLIERGLVTRERDEEDRRGYVLTLPAAGRRARDRVEKLRGELAAQVVSVLDERDLADF